MKIRNQIKVFLIGMIAFPLFCYVGVPIIRYNYNPERILFSGTKAIHEIKKFDFSSTDYEKIKETFKSIPASVEFIVYDHDKGFLVNKMSGMSYKTGEKLKSVEEIYDFIHNTTDKFIYQIEVPNLEDNQDGHLIFVSRIPRDIDEQKKGWDLIFAYVSTALAILEIFGIIITVSISITISRSITILEKNTKLISDGHLDVDLEEPKAKSHNNEITNLNENIDKMRNALKEESDRKARFIMGISHDLRTPVAVIKGYLEAISDGMISDEEEFKKALSIIESKTGQLENMIDTLINFVKINNSDWSHNLNVNNIYEILDEFAKTSVVTAQIFKRKIETSIEIEKNTFVKLDRELFLRALENLFSNAIRYTSEGDSILVKAKEDSEAIYIEIEDTGIGIEQEDVKRIFDLFFRGTNSRREEGLGIGLSVVKNIIDIHGWKIEVESEKNVATKFTIIIPKVSE